MSDQSTLESMCRSLAVACPGASASGPFLPEMENGSFLGGVRGFHGFGSFRRRDGAVVGQVAAVSTFNSPQFCLRQAADCEKLAHQAVHPSHRFTFLHIARQVLS